MDQDAPIRFEAIAAPPADTDGLVDMFEQTLAHEREVTSSINDLVDQALGQKDHATNVFLQWFVSEQVEEEDTASDMIAQLKMIGDDAHALLMMDRELASRVANVPVDFSKGVEQEGE